MKTNLEAGLYPMPTKGKLYVTTEQLLRANDESIRLGFNRNLNLPEKALKKANLKYPIEQAWRHVGYNGKDFDNENIRLMVWFGTKRDGSDLVLCTLDITHDMFVEIQGDPEIVVKPSGSSEEKGGTQ